MKIVSRLLLGATFGLVSAIATAAGAPFKQELVSYDNVQIEVNSQGTGPVIVMLPSLGRSGRDYDQVADYLQADGFRVVRPEPRGIGQSKGPMENLTVHDFARDVAAVVEHENKGPIVVVGHAWGNFPKYRFSHQVKFFDTVAHAPRTSPAIQGDDRVVRTAIGWKQRRCRLGVGHRRRLRDGGKRHGAHGTHGTNSAHGCQRALRAAVEKMSAVHVSVLRRMRGWC